MTKRKPKPGRITLAEMTAALERVEHDFGGDVDKALETLPDVPEFERLRQALIAYRDVGEMLKPKPKGT